MANAKPRYQVKADGTRTRTYSYSNMGYDNAASYALYLYECEERSNVRFIERKPNGDEHVTIVDDRFHTMF